MAKSLLERRLIDVSDRLKRLRAEIAVADEQCAVLVAEAEDARLRSLVSETPLAQAEAHEMRRHADAQSRQRDALRRAIEELERDQDALLDRMANELTVPHVPHVASAEASSSQAPTSQAPTSGS